LSALVRVVVYAWLVSFLLLPTEVGLESGNIRLAWAIAGACLGVIVSIPFGIEEWTIQNVSALQRISDECRQLRRQVGALRADNGPWAGPPIEPVVRAIRNTGAHLTIAAMVGAIMFGSVLAMLAPRLLFPSLSPGSFSCRQWCIYRDTPFIGAGLSSFAALLLFSVITQIRGCSVRDILRDRQREAASLRRELQSRCDKALASSVETSARRSALP
jgi:hypothetical protein